ncbi:MAG: ATP-binding protein [Rubrivivax sp.]
MPTESAAPDGRDASRFGAAAAGGAVAGGPTPRPTTAPESVARAPERRSIQTLLMTLVLAVLAPVAALLVYSGYDNYQRARERAAQSASALAQVAADSVEAFLDQSRQLMGQLAARKAIRAGDPTRCDPLFAEFETTYPHFKNFGLVDSDGRVLCSTQPDTVGVMAAAPGATWVERIRAGEGFIVAAPQRGPFSGRPVSMLVHPVQDADGRRSGSIVLPVDLLRFQPVVGARRLPQTTLITVIDHAGTIVARSREAERFVGTQPASPIAREILSRHEGTAVSIGADRVHRIFGFVPIAGTDWTVAAGISSDTVYADARRDAMRDGGIGAAILVFATALALALRRRIARPIMALRDVAQRVGQGESTARAATRGPAEVAEVALQFNAMLDARAEQVRALAAREADFRMLFDSSLESILRTHPDGHIVAANPAAKAMFGQQRIGEWIGANLGDVVEDNPTRWVDLVALGDLRLKPLLDTQRRHGQARGELTMQREDGSRFECAVSISSFTAANGSIGCTLFLRDLSERVQAQLLRAEKAAADGANRQKSAFLARMSHELRTPLNAILGFAQLLETEAPVTQSPRTLAMVGHVRDAGLHLLALIDEVLDLSRIEAGALSLSPEPLDLQRLLRECLALTEAMAARRHITVTVLAPSGSDGRGAAPWIRADRTRARQVLVNLISNAIKYNRDGGRVVVTLAHEESRAGEEGARVRVVIEDTGWGLNPQQIANLFQPFNRLGAERSTVEGTGLGLVIVRQLLQVMGAQIAVESTPGQGSRFTLHFPAMEPPQIATRPSDEIVRAPGHGTADRHPGSTVLYIEDHAPNIDLVRAMLALRPQIRLLTETDGEAGLAAALRERPDLILLDVNLPKMDGYEVLRRLRLDARTADVPCVALTANASAGESTRAHEAGFAAHVVKPFAIRDLLAQIDGLLGPQPS